MNITFTTIKTEDSISVTATCQIQAGITASNMPRVTEETLQNTLRAYMERGMEAFNRAQQDPGDVQSA